MKEALAEFSTQRAEFLAFDGSLRVEREDQVKLWEAMLIKWEANNSMPNPYLSKKKGTWQIALDFLHGTDSFIRILCQPGSVEVGES